MNRVILHVDMDAFYAAVEVRENPELAGKPLIIGHRGRRGVVSTCSYQARKFGVRSAMPSVTADRLCPGATWLPGSMSLYVAVSREIRRTLQDFSPLIEPVSIDEAFIDLTGIARDLTAGAAVAREIRQRIRLAHRLTASVGVAPNKFLAKLASDLDKPDGLTVIRPDDLAGSVWPLDIDRLWGVGPRTAARLRAAGLATIGSLLRCDGALLESAVGARTAAHLARLARGEDDRAVLKDRVHKSISEERTYGDDLSDSAEIDRAVFARAEGVARQLRRQELVAHTVHLKIRTGDYVTRTRSITLSSATDLTEPIVEAAREMLSKRVRLGGKGVRLIGVSASGLEPARRGQRDLFRDANEERARAVARAADAVRDKHGEGSVVRARLLGRRRKPTSSLPSVD